MELRINRSFEQEDKTNDDIEVAVKARTRLLDSRIEQINIDRSFDDYMYRLKFAIEKRFSMEMERIIFLHQIRVTTRIMGFFGNRLQKFSLFGKDAALEKIADLDNKKQELEREMEFCKSNIDQINLLMKGKVLELEAEHQKTIEDHSRLRDYDFSIS